MDLMKISGSGPVVNREVAPITPTLKHLVKPQPIQKEQKIAVPEKDVKEIQRTLDNIIQNTRFSYYINKNIDQFVVKVIDKSTDTVIKEIPSKDMQNIHENIREAIGLIFDEVI